MSKMIPQWVLSDPPKILKMNCNETGKLTKRSQKNWRYTQITLKRSTKDFRKRCCPLNTSAMRVVYNELNQYSSVKLAGQLRAQKKETTP